MNEDLVELAKRAAFVARILRILYRGFAGEELNLESGIRHRPLLSLGIATGVGALAGWWLSDRANHRRPLPPEPTPLEYLNEIIPGGVDRVRNEIIPDSLNRVREVLPASREEAVSNARTWLDTVLEPKIKGGLESVAENVPEDRVRTFLRDAARRLGNDDEPQAREITQDPDA